MRPLLLVSAAAMTVLFLAAGSAQRASGSDTVSVQLLAVNDFHGTLEPGVGGNGRIHTTPAGGAEYLATHLKQAAASNPNTLIVGGGDLVGASPLVSAAFHDEPTIEALNAMRVAVSSIGNHELDSGVLELLRLQRGGCHTPEGCRDNVPFRGADFQYLAANVVDAASGAPILPPTTVRSVGGVRIGFIGETLQGTGRLLSGEAARGVSFRDEASTANRYAAALKREGVRAIVLLIHEGGRQRADDDSADPNGCADFSGSLADIVGRLTSDIRIVVSAHTHRFYNCEIRGHTVTSASSFGRMFTRFDISIARQAGTIRRVRAVNEIVTRDVEKDHVQTELITKYAALAAPLGERVVGRVTGEITRTSNHAGESALGDLIADTQLASAQSIPGGAELAFMNDGGIRADIVPADATGRIRFADVFIVVPFKNVVTTVTLTGRQIVDLLEEQFDNPRAGEANILQVSNGFSYRYARNAARGHHVEPESVTLHGMPIAPTARLRVAASNYLLDGGDNFTVLGRGTDRQAGGLDIDALVAYLSAHSPVSPGPQNRIVRKD